MVELKQIAVEVAFAMSAEQVVVPLVIAENGTVSDAITASGVLQRFPQIDLKNNRVGIFSKLVKLDHIPREHDRIEIYLPLIADPKAVRKQRAAEGKKMKKGGGEV